MWNETSAALAASALNHESKIRLPKPAVVASVAPGSIGEELGLEPGDKLISINGIRPRDLIDYRLLTVDEILLHSTGDKLKTKYFKKHIIQRYLKRSN